MPQLNLFDAAPKARATDPVTSHEAAEQAERSGLIGKQQAEVLELVRSHSGCTSAELGELLGGHGARFIVARRLPELERLGKVRRGEKRTCRAHGTAAVTWWAM
jgi:hypothetical protein